MNYSKTAQLKINFAKKLAKAKEKSIPELKKSIQKLCNKYIRLRDANLPCISCQGVCGEWNAGHFWAQGSNGALRFNEDNIHNQGVGCNKWKHGNLLEYRIHLLIKIGEERVRFLDEHHNDVKKWTREELEELKTYFTQKIKDLETITRNL